jgi:hypothetical protein
MFGPMERDFRREVEPSRKVSRYMPTIVQFVMAPKAKVVSKIVW